MQSNGRSSKRGTPPSGNARRFGTELSQLDRQLLNLRRAEPVLHFQVLRVLQAADAVGDHQAEDAIRVLQRVIQRYNPAGRRGHQRFRYSRCHCRDAGAVLLILVGFSIATWAVIFQKWRTLRRLLVDEMEPA